MSQVSEHAYAVILAGGGGTRLWPKSRQKLPKHLLSLFGKETILQLTYQRMRQVLPPERILIVTHKNHVEEAKRQLPEMLGENWIVEPQAKNTALAIAIGAAYVASKDPEGVIINVHSDQMITDDELFLQAVVEALSISGSTENIVTIAIEPTFPHTGLGYIWVGEKLEGFDAYKAREFKEKPDLETAQSFLASGEYLWNSGMYSWSVKNLYKEFEELSPKLRDYADQIQNAVSTTDLEEIKNRIYDQAENIAIDIAVSEKATNLVVVRGAFGWSDVGDWKVVYDLSQKDSSGNARVDENNTVLIDTKNCLIESDKRMIVAIGVEDLIIVDTGDAIMICRKDRTQDVKKAVEQLKADGKEEYL
jgi:mannose-1-phosphate guanylyltransferase